MQNCSKLLTVKYSENNVNNYCDEGMNLKSSSYKLITESCNIQYTNIVARSFKRNTLIYSVYYVVK